MILLACFVAVFVDDGGAILYVKSLVPLSLNGNLTFVLLSLQEPRCTWPRPTAAHTHAQLFDDREISDLGVILEVFSDYTPNLTANLGG